MEGATFSALQRRTGFANVEPAANPKKKRYPLTFLACVGVGEDRTREKGRGVPLECLGTASYKWLVSRKWLALCWEDETKEEEERRRSREEEEEDEEEMWHEVEEEEEEEEEAEARPFPTSCLPAAYEA